MSNISDAALEFVIACRNYYKNPNELNSGPMRIAQVKLGPAALDVQTDKEKVRNALISFIIKIHNTSNWEEYEKNLPLSVEISIAEFIDELNNKNGFFLCNK